MSVATVLPGVSGPKLALVSWARLGAGGRIAPFRSGRGEGGGVYYGSIYLAKPCQLKRNELDRELEPVSYDLCTKAVHQIRF